MSILIKGIDMPISCENCFAYHSDKSGNKGCFITMHIDTRDECQSIQTLCPLIEIPAPHGRLIDWDAFNNKLDIQYADGRGKALAPTILEAEE